MAAVLHLENLKDKERDGRRAVSHLQGSVPCLLATTGSISNGASLLLKQKLASFARIGKN
jgi:hypothetical protein